MAARAESRASGGAWLQAGGIAFLALYGTTILAALAWLVSNCREIPPENRAVVTRLGALNRVQNAGLLLAWPRPFEEVTLIPSSETVIERDMQTASIAPRPSVGVTAGEGESASGPPLSDAAASVGNRLTGDSGVVQMDVKVFYTVVDPYEYVLEKTHLGAAVDRLVSRSIVAICASRDLDAILVARPELLGTASQLAEQRERLRGEVMRHINGSLAQLHAGGAGLGIELKRVDVIATLHPDTVSAFDAVLTASQDVLREIADARTDGERTLQSANEAADRAVEEAQARASERESKARADTADILELAEAIKGGLDPGLLPRIYRTRIAAILAKSGAVTLVNPKDDARLIIQGVDR